ncbi:lytic transglycosylase domain-containing protein [Aliiroseovarius crassostreae]|uniref:lytic transglycosylase domain-containing protein n=1 Tax=Aliiroseovarius crassostreae TaxID=154981 RepID=UPI003C7D75B6
MHLRLFILCLWSIAITISGSTTGFSETAPDPVAKTPKDPTACSSPRWGEVRCIREDAFARDTCIAIEDFAKRHGLDVGFFARLIWQESRFDPNAISHAGAEGIAQFMPFTARKRGLRNAFNPAEALDHSAEYLAEMTREFGNIGLAAIGYNAGEQRVEELLRYGRRPPPETRAYVKIITGMSFERWVTTPSTLPDLRLDQTRPFLDACITMAANRRLSAPPRRFATALQFRPDLIYSALAPGTSPFPKPRPKRLAPWGVQLAFGTSRANALKKFNRATRRCKGPIKGEEPDLIPVKNRVAARKGFIMARIGRDSLLEARRLCERLAAQGCPCRVYRNER